jgi:hypothetical protein
MKEKFKKITYAIKQASSIMINEILSSVCEKANRSTENIKLITLTYNMMVS